MMMNGQYMRNQVNLLLDELIDQVWLNIYNKNREKNEIINIDIDRDKDIEGYLNIYKRLQMINLSL